MYASFKYLKSISKHTEMPPRKSIKEEEDETVETIELDEDAVEEDTDDLEDEDLEEEDEEEMEDLSTILSTYLSNADGMNVVDAIMALQHSVDKCTKVISKALSHKGPSAWHDGQSSINVRPGHRSPQSTVLDVPTHSLEAARVSWKNGDVRNSPLHTS